MKPGAVKQDHQIRENEDSKHTTQQHNFMKSNFQPHIASDCPHPPPTPDFQQYFLYYNDHS